MVANHPVRLPPEGSVTFACRCMEWKIRFWVPCLKATHFLCPERRHIGTLPCPFCNPLTLLEIFPQVVYHQVWSKWERKEMWLRRKVHLSVLYQINFSGVAYTWGNVTPGILRRSAVFHRIARGGGGKHSFLLHWLLKTSLFCLNELTQHSLPWWIRVLSLYFAPFWHRTIPPPLEPLSDCESPFEASDPSWWMPSLCELEKRAALSDVLLNLHKNGFPLPLGV